jgi:hypothetical protein
MRTMHSLLAVQSIIIILLSVNRLTPWTLGYVARNEFLRWYDLNNMLILPLISVVAFYLLKKHMERLNTPSSQREQLYLNVVFIIGIYLLAASYGDHEVTNYLNTRFCLPTSAETAPEAVCRIVAFNDDEFSHWVFFAGFVLINVSLMLYQLVFKHPESLSATDRVLLGINAVFIALGVFANLAFEEIGIDLYVVAFLALIAVVLWQRWKQQPMLIYYSIAYTLALIGTALYKLIA